MSFGENEVYYRIIQVCSDDKMLTVVEMQDFDEIDYDPDRFLCEKGTRDRLRFSTESEAVEYLNEFIKPECISPEYLYKTTKYNDNFYK